MTPLKLLKVVPETVELAFIFVDVVLLTAARVLDAKVLLLFVDEVEFCLEISTIIYYWIIVY